MDEILDTSKWMLIQKNHRKELKNQKYQKSGSKRKKCFTGVQITWSSFIGGRAREIPLPLLAQLRAYGEKNGCPQLIGKDARVEGTQVETGREQGAGTRSHGGSQAGGQTPPILKLGPSLLRRACAVPVSLAFPHQPPCLHLHLHRSHSPHPHHPALALAPLCSQITHPVSWFEITVVDRVYIEYLLVGVEVCSPLS